jgi:hypothetical protein
VVASGGRGSRDRNMFLLATLVCCGYRGLHLGIEELNVQMASAGVLG